MAMASFESQEMVHMEEGARETAGNNTTRKRVVGGGRGGDGGDGELSFEQNFMDEEVPPWQSQLTLRSVVVSFLLSFMFTFIVMRLNVTTGIIPSLSVAAGLLGFFLMKLWTTVLSKLGFWKGKPFTRQENTVIQTCVVAASGIAFSSGYASYILGMTERVAAQLGAGNTPENVMKLSLVWMIGFLFVVSFLGLFSILPLRKIMVVDYKLTYPSGTATAYLINSFHTPKGAEQAKKQVSVLFKFFSGSFVWAFFQWFFSAGDDCGFANFPTFGFQAYERKFYFDFSSTYVGVGMICSYLINLSMLFGAVISWGILWPHIETKKGIWYDAKLSGGSLRGIQGYRVFIAISMILGEGLYHFLFVLAKTVFAIIKAVSSRKSNQEADPRPNADGTDKATSFDEERRKECFMKDQIPNWVAGVGYVSLAILAIIVVPLIFHPLKWYHVALIYIIAPILAFCNAYGCGLTDWSLASSYGKIAIFVLGSWVGTSNGGIIAGLAACGVMMSIVSSASDLMQDFKTGYLTLASPRSMFFSQIIGTAMGCVISPLVFWIFFYKAFPTLGEPNSSYPAPFGSLYRGIALLGTEGFSALPKHCLTLSLVFFLVAFFLNVARDVLKHFDIKFHIASKTIKVHNFVPSAMAMAVPFYLGGYFVIDMCVGSLVRFLMELKSKTWADAFAPAIASGLICGDSLWGMPQSILSLSNVQAPICMKFLSRAANAKLAG